ncbi:hypothetical protein Hanom_Chr14g01266721 [Helianthus anomalus]
MILGFISLILTFTQYYIAEICIPVDGTMPIITVKGLHQLHILIFFLAVLPVAYSAISVSQNSWVE